MPKLISNLEQHIVQAGKARLLNDGYSGFTMRGLAADCSVAPGTLYNYFPSKEMLIAAIMLDDWLVFYRRAQGEARESGNPVEGLHCLYRAVEDFSRIYRSVWEGYYAGAPGSLPITSARHEMLVGQLQSVTAELCERFSCGFCEALPRYLAETVLHCAITPGMEFQNVEPIFAKLLEQS